MKLEGKVAFVTGSSIGIGKAVAELFAKEGADVIVCSSTTVAEGERVAANLKGFGTNSTYIQADLTKEMAVKEVFEVIKRKYGILNILVNNAGRSIDIGFSDITQHTLQYDFDANFTLTALCSKYAIELMKGEGWIINTSSIRGIDYAGKPNKMGYCAGKAAVISFTKQLAIELAPDIYVNAVAPGFIRSRERDNIPEDVKREWLSKIPIKKFIEPEEIAEVYLLLATSKIFTGSIITPDGGYTILNR